MKYIHRISVSREVGGGGDCGGNKRRWVRFSGPHYQRPHRRLGSVRYNGTLADQQRTVGGKGLMEMGGVQVDGGSQRSGMLTFNLVLDDVKRRREVLSRF